MSTVLEILRVAKGFTASGLSRELGFSPTVITQIENGLAAWPNLRLRICDFFGVDSAVLFEDGGHVRKIASERIIEMIKEVS